MPSIASGTPTPNNNPVNAVTSACANVPSWLLFADVSAQAIRLYATLEQLPPGTHPSRGALAESMHCSRATFDRAMRELTKIGAATIERRWAESAEGEPAAARSATRRMLATSRYRLHPDPPIGLAESSESPRWRPPRGKKRISLRLRLAVYERDGYACVTCGTNKELSLDHVVPESKGGATDADNLVCMCIPCNLRKGTS